MAIIINRLTKIFGALEKALAYIFHKLFPNKRFSLPPQAAPVTKGDQSSRKIPKILWQTYFSHQVTLPAYVTYLFNRLMSLDWAYRLHDDAMMQAYVENYGDVRLIQAYGKLKNGAARADLWRLFVLYREGGVYVDMDANILWPLSRLIKPEDDLLVLRNKGGYTNYFMAAAPGHPLYKKIMDRVIENILAEKVDQGVFHLTGPGVWDEVIGHETVPSRFYRNTCVQGSFTSEYFQYMDQPQGKWIHAKAHEVMHLEDKGD